MGAKKQPKKITVREDLGGISCWEFDGSLRSIITQLETYIKEHGEDVYFDYRSDGYESYSDSPGFRLMKNREETDEELKKRIEAERTQQALLEARDRKEFERLSKKFGEKK